MNNGNNNNDNYSFKHRVRKKVLNVLIELNEIKSLPDNQKTLYALDRQDYLERRVKYLLIPIENQIQSNRLLNKNYISYLLNNHDVIDLLIEKAGGSQTIESKIKGIN